MKPLRALVFTRVLLPAVVSVMGCGPRRPPQSLPPVRVAEQIHEIQPRLSAGPYSLWLAWEWQGLDSERPLLFLNDVPVPLLGNMNLTSLALPGPNVFELRWLKAPQSSLSYRLRVLIRSPSTEAIVLETQSYLTPTELRLGKQARAKDFRFSFPESHPAPEWWQAKREVENIDPNRCRVSGFGRVLSCKSGEPSKWEHRYRMSGEWKVLQILQ
jgi:hypothetical protein